ncbi:MAG: hypothetical protein OEV44_09785 [Spirochaetota bacterium]|nr:hypothetical protein [Spirochaetota bacterium]
MLIIIELVLILVFLTVLSVFTNEKGILILFSKEISPVVLSLISILMGIILLIPILIKIQINHRKEIKNLKNEMYKLKGLSSNDPKQISYDK